MKDLLKAGMSTQAIHGGEELIKEMGHHGAPIFQTSTYSYKNVKEASAAFIAFGTAQETLEEAPNIYARLGHDNARMVEHKLALLEKGERCMLYNSGMAAVHSLVMGFLKSGDHIITNKSLYGGTHSYLHHTLPPFNITTDSIDLNDSELLEKTIKESTKLIYFETPANPTLYLTDIEKVVAIAHKHNIVVAVDNTFMSPFLQQPLTLGADVVLHSCTKYIGGHGDVVAGALISSKEFIEKLRPNTIEFGGYIPPFSAWLLQRGLKTLNLRMERHCSNAMTVAKFLENHPKIERVFYPGLESFEQHDLAKKQMRDFGGMISLLLKGGIEGAEIFLNNLELFGLAVSLGSVDSLAQSPALMTHAPVPKADREAAGISDSLVRLSIGVENVEDIIHDLENALSKL